MKQDSSTERPQPEALPSQVAWSCGTALAIFAALMISLLFMSIARYQYYVATLDFQPTDSIGIKRDASYFEDIWDHQHSAASMYKPPSSGRLWDWVGERQIRNTLDPPPAAFLMLSYWYIPALLWILLMGVTSGYRLLAQRKFRAATLLIICAGLPWWVLLVAGPNSARAAEEYKTNGYIRITERGAPIIVALEAFHAEHGNYPETLAELAPKFLVAIPRADIAPCPEFIYLPIVKVNPPEKARIPSYKLGVRMFHMMSYSEMPYLLYYTPDKKYSGANRRIGDWAIRNEQSYLIP
jgi:hypothetical protein